MIELQSEGERLDHEMMLAMTRVSLDGHGMIDPFSRHVELDFAAAWPGKMVRVRFDNGKTDWRNINRLMLQSMRLMLNAKNRKRLSV